jgi:hypothetical protein
LSFQKGDEFIVLAKPTGNIWKGHNNGKVGRFLSRLVEVVDAGTATATNGATSPRAGAAPAADAAAAKARDDDAAKPQPSDAKAAAAPTTTPTTTAASSSSSSSSRPTAAKRRPDSARSPRAKSVNMGQRPFVAGTATLKRHKSSTTNTYVAKWPFEP